MEVLRYTAFSADPAGGNPAGVVLDATGLDDATMLATSRPTSATRRPRSWWTAAADRFAVRYFSPLAEVPFCGHATIASAVAYAERHGAGTMLLDTRAGEVAVETSADPAGLTTATLTSVAAPGRAARAGRPATAAGRAAVVCRTSSTRTLPRGWRTPARGTRSLAVRDRSRLADLDYDFDALGDADGRAGLDDGGPGVAGRAGPVRRPQPVPAGRRRARTPPPARPPQRSAATCASSGWCRCRPPSPCTRATTWVGRACSPSRCRPRRAAASA